MSYRSSFAIATLTLVTSAAACGSSSDSTGGGGTAQGGGGAAQGGGGAGGAVPPIPEASSKLPRTPASKVPHASLAAAVTANNAFAVDLYTRLRADAGATNILTSPLSASIALTMTYAGARGQTATEMATALHLGDADKSIFEGQNALSQALDKRAAIALAADRQSAKSNGQEAPSPSDYQLQVVNSVWGQKSLTWKAPFLDVLAQDYGTGVFLEDLVHEPEPTRKTINAWVSAKTADKINDLLPVGALDGSLMVLVNAIHLKLHWINAFETSATAPAKFTKTDGSTVTTPFMHQTETFPYVDDGKAQIIGMPLAGGQLSVVIALPHGSLADYEGELLEGSAALSQPHSTEGVILSLPKVDFTSPTFSLAPSLKAMGMSTPFTSSADFSGLNDTKPLFIFDVLQKTMVAMEEKGVEAAAATAVILGGSGGGGSGSPVSMTVDRPYLMAIVDVPTGAILFLGHIADPSGTGG